VPVDPLTVNLLIAVPAVHGLLVSFARWQYVENHELQKEIAEDHLNAKLLNTPDRAERVDQLIRLAETIKVGAISFLFAEYLYMAVYVVLFSVLLVFLTDILTTFAFVLGAVTSILCGWIGMMIAVKTNVKTTHESWNSLKDGYEIAIAGGSVMGLSLVSLGVLALFALMQVAPLIASDGGKDLLKLYESLAGYGLGGSSIALFGRVGGGIYTKAADVGADLSGKINANLPEDDYRNPAVIADNVGDNVGDIAGMGADLFGSFAESTCAALVLAASSEGLKANHCSMMYPVLISSLGIVVGWVTLVLTGCLPCYKVSSDASVEKALKGILIVSTILMTPLVWYLSRFCLPDTFTFTGSDMTVKWWYCATSVLLGLWSGMIIGAVTEYYTSHSYSPVRSIAESQRQSAATGVILGLALGYKSCIVPTFCLGATILVAHSLCGMYGIALAALGMLGTMTMALTIDAYGPISDNAGGLAEMAELPKEVRDRTDILDAAGNTTAAIGKGFAIGSAALVSLALFGAFCVRAGVTQVDVLNPWVFTGLLFGAMLPQAFSAMTMQSVGSAADDMVKECAKQFDRMFVKDAAGKLTGVVKEGEHPDYDACIKISTDASLREMIAPGALVILSPLVAGLGFGKNACAGLMSGALVTSVQLAISMSNSGGAWDNAKKYITGGGLGDNDRKGSEAHANSVTGDTVGDPLKDTSGPALNIVMKLTAIISLVFGKAIAEHSAADGGPLWKIGGLGAQ